MSIMNHWLMKIGIKSKPVPRTKYDGGRGRPKSKSWVTKYGDKIPLRNLTDEHLDNILRMLGRMHGELYPDLLRERRRRAKLARRRRNDEMASCITSHFEDEVPF